MVWRLFDDAEDFAEQAGSLFGAQPVATTIVQTVVAEVRGDEHRYQPPYLWALDLRDGVARGLAWRTPPFGIGIVHDDPDAARRLADVLHAADRRDLLDATLVLGKSPAAQAFAAGWARRNHLAIGAETALTLYVLPSAEDLLDPLTVAGTDRRATGADLDLVTRWVIAFDADAHTGVPGAERRQARAMIAEQRLWLRVVDGEPVCMVAGRPPAAGYSRIGPVFTPRAHRGNGYAAALIAHVCRIRFAAGARGICLYADDANATSTGVYVRLGFEPVLAWVDIPLLRG